jgi:hypothetical protein
LIAANRKRPLGIGDGVEYDVFVQDALDNLVLQFKLRSRSDGTYSYIQTLAASKEYTRTKGS